MSSEASSSKHHHHSHHLPHFHGRRQHMPYEDHHDLSMLLDPAYSRPRSTSSQTRVYKDTHGDLHDPDYRHFPSTSSYGSSSSTTSGGRRSKRVNSASSSIARPSWELGLGNGMDEEEFAAYYNDGEDDYYHHQHQSKRSSYSHSPTAYSPSSSATSSPSSFTTSLSDTDLSYYPSSNTSPTSPTSPTSSCKLTKRLLTRTTHRSSFVEEHVHPYEVDDNVWADDAEETRSLPEERDREREQSPSPTGSVTTSEAMRKQWQATKLSVRFGVFRAQRRVKEALGAGKR